MIFTKCFRRNLRRKITNNIIDLTNYYNMPHHVIEFIIKSFHFQHIFWVYLSLFHCPNYLFIFGLVISLILFILFFYFDGCVLSNVEYKLCKNKKHFINIIDPFLYVLKKDINTHNRYFYTLYLASFYFAICILKIIHMNIK